MLFMLCVGALAGARQYNREDFLLEDRSRSKSRDIDYAFQILSTYKRYWQGSYRFAPSKQLKITVMPSVSALQKLAGVHHLIGGWYTASGVFIQPLDVLRKVGMLERVLFIELAHHYIQEYTAGNCPGWWDELMALDNWHVYQGSLPDPLSGTVNWNYSQLSRINSFVGKTAKSQDFFSFLENFAFFLKKKYSPKILQQIMEQLRRQVPLEEAFYVRTGERLEKEYEDFKGASRRWR